MKQNDSITLNVPITIWYHGEKNDEEKRALEIEQCQMFASHIFDFIQRLGWIGENEGMDGGDLHDILDSLGHFGAGLMECQQKLMMQTPHPTLEKNEIVKLLSEISGGKPKAGTHEKLIEKVREYFNLD